MTEFRADLHCHSTCSDGSLSPKEIIHLAKEIGLSAISITDHDTVEAYVSAIPLSKELGLTLLPGIELSAAMNGISVHILGYGFQPDDPIIRSFCERHVKRRQERNLAILNLLQKHGMSISEEDLKTLPSTENVRSTIGRPHIALAMVKKGYVETIQDAFKKFIGEDKPCYTSGYSFTVEETIDIIHQAKGLAVIAHPHLINHPSILQALLTMNFDGIECYYGNFSSRDYERWLKIAKKHNWLVTGGSDFHGAIKPGLSLGSSWIDEKAFQAIQQHIK